MGGPDDSSTWDEIIPVLNQAGLRTITPMARGFGNTRFLSPQAPRTGNTAMLAIDAMETMDALGIARLSIAGHDWGRQYRRSDGGGGWAPRIERIAMLSTPLATGWLEDAAVLACAATMVSLVSGHGTRRTGRTRRRQGLRSHHVGKPGRHRAGSMTPPSSASRPPSPIPTGVDVTLHSYRSRWDEAEIDPASKWLDDRTKAAKNLALPTLYFQGEADGVNPPRTSERMAEKFTGPVRGASCCPVSDTSRPVKRRWR